jgi:hypothetical protein
MFDGGESANNRARLAVMERARIKNGEGVSMRFVTGLAVRARSPF